ncbi:M10 family metallopeptidase C-terminal domain-containing protein [Methylocucumis oryzae]|uniref:Peptidase M10 serralysin C-terminal domain-containing protein n=1 Tax=Methylocucumis oryzae TaxID=1632867 RepID=A0A0F3INC7_9GAMM|nr:M10 family metallopeptidase C-terminal domain-containing protein [Methylocucumis oryzae]KJV08058.1 hypothetical protein VZ94_00410 [Methylocucumis oryzae]
MEAGTIFFSFTEIKTGYDTITDFHRGDDIIDLYNIDANNHTYDGNNKFTYIGKGDFYAEGQIIFNPDTHYLLLNIDDNFDTAEIIIKVLGVTEMNQFDFYL